MSSSLSSTQQNLPPAHPTHNQRISLLDNTAPPSESLSASASDENLPSHLPGRRETLRKAIAQRKYRRWSTEPFASFDNSEEDLTEESPDPKAGGVVERVGEDEEVVIGGGDGAEERETRPGRNRSDTGGNRGPETGEGVAERRTGRVKKGLPEKEVAEIDVLYENQRGMFMCGIPLFSSKGLLNFDPPPWQTRHHRPSLVSILDAQVPDPTWTWAWKSWYVDMTTDVDEEGWTYSFSFNPSFSWHGTHIWFHSFVRRRRWLRKRVKLQAQGDAQGEQERPHGLNQDYFTIHSTGAGSAVKGGKNRRSVMEGAAWSWKDEDGDGREDSEQAAEVGVFSVPQLMDVIRGSRLDREKIEAVRAFLRDGGEEVIYLPERVPDVMALMIFQASRRQLLSLLVEEESRAVAESEGRAPVAEPGVPEAPLPPVQSEPTTPLSEVSVGSAGALLPASPALVPPVQPGKSAPALLETQTDLPTPDPDAEKKAREAAARRVKVLREALKIAEEKVRKAEYWSDAADVAANGESPTKRFGVGGAGFGSGEDGRPAIEWVEGRVDVKGKGKGKGRA